ncbi:peptidoglycan DD-metalloendopeptidase family protein [Kribbella sandramycini]|uniref:Peptidoglycan DD-metalloendopeptidase family protein n=1 Tax=Kribbella sandramycini TaxID=60450 RepID=A0A7Y4KZN1_9ACTN|nr:phage tail tip lysozyme [Kribbella sandramycini]MBB6565334.1 hypothetical protein [Kribbella sandramycini]NOL41603.1 peptidoglycan DD-metalloendopeptidase family protein [Kribbella sandramycini]
MTSKVPQFLGLSFGGLLLPFIVLFALIAGSLMGIEASADDCGTSSGQSSAFAWPTDEREFDEEWSAEHKGVDFDVDEGSPVYAAESGEVIYNANNEIRIKHGSGVETRYKFFKELTAQVGAQVTRGQKIGTSGSGDEEEGASGEHLHFELWVDQGNGPESVDPKEDSFGEAGTGGSGAGCCAGGPLVGSNEQQQAFNYLVANGYSKEQAAGVVGNMIVESAGVHPMILQNTPASQKTRAQDAEGSSLGYGIVQWTPAGKLITQSRQAGVSYETIETLAYQLDFLRRQLIGETKSPEKFAGDKLRATTTVDDATYAFGYYYERFGAKDDPNAYTVRKQGARQVLETYGGGTGNPGTGPSTGCGAGSGNIAEVAKSLAWPEEGHDTSGSVNGGEATAKPEFVAAMKKYNDPRGYLAYTDCGRFVATVMHMSGADTKFPKVSTGVQFNYMKTSGKYNSWHGTPPGGMKPGDILNGPGHTYLYVGPWGKEGRGYTAASGSLGGHVPEAGHLYGVGGQFTVFRLKPAAGTTPVPEA